MDSLTQVVLGSAVCAVVVRQPVRRALAYGAVLGTLPDLDVLLLGHLDPVAQFVQHRSFSHSLFVLSLLAWPLAWLLRRIDRRLQGVPPARWALAVWLVLITHPLLDAFTIYGTQLWWPLPVAPVGIGSVFIIDPLYTLPLLGAVIWALIRPRADSVRRGLLGALLLSQAYLLWGVLAMELAVSSAARSIAAHGAEVSRIRATPAPFTSLLWRVMIEIDGGYQEAWYSVLSPGAGFEWHRIAERSALPSDLPDVPALETLRWFSDDYLRYEVVEGRLRVSDLRMGLDPDYFFSFDVAERDNGRWQPIFPPERAPAIRSDWARLKAVYQAL